MELTHISELDYNELRYEQFIPQGPKVFSMMALLLSVRYPDIKLWEIIGKNGRHAQGQGLPASDPVIVKASFLDDENEEDD